MSNQDIITAIYNKYREWGYSKKYANGAILLMTNEDIGCFYEEHIKGA